MKNIKTLSKSKLKSAKIYSLGVLDITKINMYSLSFDFLINEPNLYKRKSKIG